jgi:hypothetical protein
MPSPFYVFYIALDDETDILKQIINHYHEGKHSDDPRKNSLVQI